MTLEQENWAIASLMDKDLGQGAEAFIAERIGALSRAGDDETAERWRLIRHCLNALRLKGPTE